MEWSGAGVQSKSRLNSVDDDDDDKDSALKEAHIGVGAPCVWFLELWPRVSTLYICTRSLSRIEVEARVVRAINYRVHHPLLRRGERRKCTVNIVL